MIPVSFEFFPPQTLEATFRLAETAAELAVFRPDYVSVTYGAGGGTKGPSLETVKSLVSRGFDVAAHLTCAGASRAETLETAGRFAEAGVRRLVALRGDAPRGERFRPHPDGFASSVELVEALARTGRFEILVGAYPDPHPDSARAGADVEWLKRKLDAGAAGAVTQFFFEAETYFRFRDACARAGIAAPIVPGILPIEDWARARRFAETCGARIPPKLAGDFGIATRDGRARDFGLVHATQLCERLRAGGVPGFHFYTLNRAGLTRDIVTALGLAAPLGQVA